MTVPFSFMQPTAQKLVTCQKISHYYDLDSVSSLLWHYELFDMTTPFSLQHIRSEVYLIIMTQTMLLLYYDINNYLPWQFPLVSYSLQPIKSEPYLITMTQTRLVLYYDINNSLPWQFSSAPSGHSSELTNISKQVWTCFVMVLPLKNVCELKLSWYSL